jgi:hypothetical protein
MVCFVPDRNIHNARNVTAIIDFGSLAVALWVLYVLV